MLTCTCDCYINSLLTSCLHIHCYALKLHVTRGAGINFSTDQGRQLHKKSTAAWLGPAVRCAHSAGLVRTSAHYVYNMYVLVQCFVHNAQLGRARLLCISCTGAAPALSCYSEFNTRLDAVIGWKAWLTTLLLRHWTIVSFSIWLDSNNFAMLTTGACPQAVCSSIISQGLLAATRVCCRKCC